MGAGRVHGIVRESMRRLRISRFHHTASQSWRKFLSNYGPIWPPRIVKRGRQRCEVGCTEFGVQGPHLPTITEEFAR